MSGRQTSMRSRRRSSGRSGILQAVFRVLSALALVVVPLNMVANAQMHAETTQLAAHGSDCDMGPKHRPDGPADTSQCTIACTSLPAPRTAILPGSVPAPALLLTAQLTVILDGADLEPVPPPPRTA